MAVECCRCGNFVVQQRYVLTVMILLGLVLMYCLRLYLNIAITEIAIPINATESAQKDVCPEFPDEKIEVKGGSYNWTETQQAIILLAFFVGYLITHVPGGIVADKYGGKYTLAITAFVSILVSLVTPVIITSLDWRWVVTIRIVLGLAQGPLFPSLATLLARWVPERERSTLGGLVYSGVFLGTVTGSVISGYVISWSQTWKLGFYFWGAVVLLWLLIFLVTCYAEPSMHPFISPEEAELLKREIGDIKRYKTPWKKICTDSAVLAYCMLQIGHDWLTYTLITCLPKFFKSVLKFNIVQTGILTSVCFGLMWSFSVIFGWISDYLTNNQYTTIPTIRKIYAIISGIGPSACAVVAGYMGCDRVRVVSVLWVGMVLMGPWFPGPKVNTLDLSKNFSGVLMSITNGAGVLSGMVTPYVVAVFAPNSTPREWQYVFWVSLLVSVITLIIFLIWGSSERSEWDLEPEEK